MQIASEYLVADLISQNSITVCEGEGQETYGVWDSLWNKIKHLVTTEYVDSPFYNQTLKPLNKN